MLENHIAIEADRWDDMSINDLYEQLSVLRARAVTASNMSSMEMLRQINLGIKQCEAVISKKSNEDPISI